ncbi:MAG: kelch repeat-containing protein [Kofleriaceae bacterium]
MRSSWLLACLVLVASCGRLGFDGARDAGLAEVTPGLDARPDASFTTRTWVDRASNTPGLLFAPKMVYHPIRRTVILYGGGGGQTPNIVSDAMWEWDGATWTQLCTSCAPGGRKYHAMTYDSGRDRIVLFGGRPGGVPLDDLWEWDGTTWTERPRSGTWPPGREGGQMTYDPDRGRVILAGGCGRTDIYEWDGTSWTQGADAPGPLGGFGTAMTYDRTNHRTLVVADTCDVTQTRDELFAWDGSAWSTVCTACSGLPRIDATVIHDLALGVTYLAGGFDGGEIRGTEVLENDRWRPLYNMPPERDSVGAAYDEARDVIVMYGGNGAPCGGDCDETWELVPD